MILQEKAMLVNLSISSWTASKKDRAASTDIKKSKGANDKAGWFNKRLIDPTALQTVGKVEGQARAMHYSMTLPWGDNGDRILPAAAYMDYMDKLRGLRVDFEHAVSDFVRDYPQRVQDARVMLGTMYDPADYPEPGQIKHRFSIHTVFTPVPSAADFRVDVAVEEQDEIRKSITASVEKRLQNATRECWVRLTDVVECMARALEDPDRVFRDSLVENIRATCEILPKLNLTSDYQLDATIKHVRNTLLIEPDSLRRDKKLRAVTAEQAQIIYEGILTWVKSQTTSQ